MNKTRTTGSGVGKNLITRRHVQPIPYLVEGGSINDVFWFSSPRLGSDRSYLARTIQTAIHVTPKNTHEWTPADNLSNEK